MLIGKIFEWGCTKEKIKSKRSLIELQNKINSLEQQTLDYYRIAYLLSEISKLISWLNDTKITANSDLISCIDATVYTLTVCAIRDDKELSLADLQSGEVVENLNKVFIDSDGKVVDMKALKDEILLGNYSENKEVISLENKQKRERLILKIISNYEFIQRVKELKIGAENG